MRLLKNNAAVDQMRVESITGSLELLLENGEIDAVKELLTAARDEQHEISEPTRKAVKGERLLEGGQLPKDVRNVLLCCLQEDDGAIKLVDPYEPMVELANDTTAPQSDAKSAVSALLLIEKNQPMLRALFTIAHSGEKAQDEEKDLLKGTSLIAADGQMNPTLRNVVLSAVRENGLIG